MDESSTGTFRQIAEHGIGKWFEAMKTGQWKIFLEAVSPDFEMLIPYRNRIELWPRSAAPFNLDLHLKNVFESLDLDQKKSISQGNRILFFIPAHGEVDHQTSHPKFELVLWVTVENSKISRLTAFINIEQVLHFF